MRATAVADIFLPGSGLLADGRTGHGLTVITFALGSATAFLVAGAIANAEWISALRGIALGGFAVAAAAAALLRRWYARRAAYDRGAVLALCRTVTSAYLRDRLPEAETAARAVLRLAPDESGAWRQLALVLAARGDAAGAARCTATAARIDAR